jgi:hypothetical protein
MCKNDVMDVMEVVAASISFIKSRSLNHRQFKKYLADLFSDYVVSYYCEVRYNAMQSSAIADWSGH